MNAKLDNAPELATARDIVITECEDKQAREWDDLVAQAQGSFYHLYAWKKLNRQALGHDSIYLQARTAGAIVGVLPLTIVSSRLFGRIVCSMPFVNFGGPCALDDATRALLAAHAKAIADRVNARYLELRCLEPVDTDMPVSTHKVSLTLALTPDPDVLWNAFSSKHRTTVRRSFKNGLSVRSGGLDLLPQFYALMLESWRNLGTPLYAPTYFRSLLETFADSSRIFVCYHNDTPIATALNGYYGGTAEGMWAGGTPAARNLQANYALYWEMIRDACERGCRVYHLGRSTAESGSEDFKKKWNATVTQLHWYFHSPKGAAMPELNVANPKYRLAIATWQRLPTWAARVAGPALARCIP